MELLDIGALFVTTFLGAFLAFGLENLRERRRLTDWVRQHLGNLREIISRENDQIGDIDGLLSATIAACDAWATAKKQDEVTEEQWELIGSAIIARAPDFGAVVRSEALTVLPPGLALSLSQTETMATNMESLSNQLQASFASLEDRWFERTVPLSVPDLRRVQRYREGVDQLRQTIDAVREPLRTLVAGIGDWID
jgi:hypothetical protein